MITAKNQFILEREMLAEMQWLLNGTDLPHEERERVNNMLTDGMTEAEYDELKKKLTDRQTTELSRVRNGETLNQWQINKAVRQAAKNE